MYLVVSKWQVVPGHEADVEKQGRVMRDYLREQPEVKLLESFDSGPGETVVCIGYSDENAYKRLIDDPQGRFQKALADHGFENHAKWLWSERGNARPA